MAGHSQFKNIMHKKGKQDAIRSKLFSKLAREITVAAKMGLPDPNMNARLRAAVLAAKAENMPKDNIERAIKKAAGRAPVIANVSEAGTSIAVDLAHHAKAHGAAAVMASVPYYWTPPESMLIEHRSEEHTSELQSH